MGTATSPRLSFSHDLSQSDLSPAMTDVGRLDDSLPLDPADSADFDFSISTQVSTHDPSPADELFSDGKILPLMIKNSIATPSTSPPPPKPNRTVPAAPILRSKGSLREIMAALDDDGDEGTNPRKDGPSRSFWRFGRSSSVGGGKARTGSICPFPLARSKSTGSYSNPIQKPRRGTNQNNNNNNNNNNSNSSLSFRKTSSLNAKASYYYHHNKRSSCGNAIQISPVLNVRIPRGGGGSGSSSCSSSSSNNNNNNNKYNPSVLTFLLCNCKDKNMKRSAISFSP